MIPSLRGNATVTTCVSSGSLSRQAPVLITANTHPDTPRTQYINRLKKWFTHESSKEICDNIESHMQRARNSHNVFFDYVKNLFPNQTITIENVYPMAFPRNHAWTGIMKLSGDLDPQDLAKRISNAKPKEQWLWFARQKFIADKSLEFLQTTGFLPQGENVVIADLLCETGAFLQALNRNQAPHKYAYGIDKDQEITNIGQEFAKHDSSIYQIKHRELNLLNDNINTPFYLQEKADFIYISAPFIGASKEDLNTFLGSIRENYLKKDGKIFFGISCAATPHVAGDNQLPYLNEVLEKHFNCEFVTAEECEHHGYCEKNRMIADTYSAFYILSHKNSE